MTFKPVLSETVSRDGDQRPFNCVACVYPSGRRDGVSAPQRAGRSVKPEGNAVKLVGDETVARW